MGQLKTLQGSGPSCPLHPGDSRGHFREQRLRGALLQGQETGRQGVGCSPGAQLSLLSGGVHEETGGRGVERTRSQGGGAAVRVLLCDCPQFILTASCDSSQGLGVGGGGSQGRQWRNWWEPGSGLEVLGSQGAGELGKLEWVGAMGWRCSQGGLGPHTRRVAEPGPQPGLPSSSFAPLAGPLQQVRPLPGVIPDQ